MDTYDGRIYSITYISEWLGVPVPTIRYWTSQYSAYFSDDAAPEQGATRRFTQDDLLVVNTLRYLQDKSGGRLDSDEAKQKLSTKWRYEVLPPERSDKEKEALNDVELVPADRLERIKEISTGRLFQLEERIEELQIAIQERDERILSLKHDYDQLNADHRALQNRNQEQTTEIQKLLEQRQTLIEEKARAEEKLKSAQLDKERITGDVTRLEEMAKERDKLLHAAGMQDAEMERIKSELALERERAASRRDLERSKRMTVYIVVGIFGCIGLALIIGTIVLLATGGL